MISLLSLLFFLYNLWWEKKIRIPNKYFIIIRIILIVDPWSLHLVEHGSLNISLRKRNVYRSGIVSDVKRTNKSKKKIVQVEGETLMRSRVTAQHDGATSTMLSRRTFYKCRLATLYDRVDKIRSHFKAAIKNDEINYYIRGYKMNAIFSKHLITYFRALNSRLRPVRILQTR